MSTKRFHRRGLNLLERTKVFTLEKSFSVEEHLIVLIYAPISGCHEVM